MSKTTGRAAAAAPKAFSPNPDDDRVANEDSPAFRAGYGARKAHGWWRGCPHLYDSQEFVDWQAGWRKAYIERPD